jgi:hypothetical protein
LAGADATGRDFMGTLTNPMSISGRVTNGGAPVAGLRIDLSGTATAEAFTDANGDYGFAGLADGAYAVTPLATSYSSVPASRSVTLAVTSIAGQDFTAVPIQRVIYSQDPQPNLPLPDYQTVTSTIDVGPTST